MRVTRAKYQVDSDGMWLCLLGRKEQVGKAVERFVQHKEHECEIKRKRNRRSLDANGYLWVLMDKIADVVGGTKEEVYRRAIHDVGVFEVVPVRVDAIDQWVANWESGGVGRVCEVLGDSKLDGYVKTMCYFGSSVYDSKQFSRLVEWVVGEAKEQGIETLTPKEIEGLKRIGEERK